MPQGGRTPHGYYDDLRNRADLSTRRVGSVDVLDVAQRNDGGTGDEEADGALRSGGEVALCHLVGLYPFTTHDSDGAGDGADDAYASGHHRSLVDTYFDLAATLMAVHHFNNGIGAVVDDVAGIDGRCNVRLTTEFLDTEHSVFPSVKALTDVVGRRGATATGTTNSNNSSSSSADGGGGGGPSGGVLPCAVLGAHRSAVTGPTALTSGVYGLPQMSFSSPSTDLSDRAKYPLFSRVVPPADASASLAVRHLADHLGAGHCAVLFVDDADGDAVQKAFQHEALHGVQGGGDGGGGGGGSTMKVASFPLPYRPSEDEVRDTIRLIRETGYRHVFAVLEGAGHYDAVMAEAYRQGIAGPESGYFWLFSAGLVDEHVGWNRYGVGSDLARASAGVGVLALRGGRAGMDGYDRFAASWSAGGDADEDEKEEAVNYLNSKVPPPSSATVSRFVLRPNIYGQLKPNSYMPFAYDAVMSLGLAACAAANANGTYFDGPQYADEIVRSTSFAGATGTVRFDPSTASRKPTGSVFVILNAVPDRPVGGDGDGNGDGPTDARSEELSEGDDNWVTFTMRDSIVFMPNKDGSGWDRVEEAPFLYADGTKSAPADLPSLDVQMNYIGNVRMLGYFLFGIVALLSLAFAVWIHRYRNQRVVRASQPPFLFMICVGTVVLASSIIPMTVDDQYVSQRGCDIACMCVPWLFSIGFVVVFCALFSKTWRINQIFHNPDRFKRIKVTPQDVLVPFLLLMAINIIVLILFTVISPLKFDRRAYVGTDSFDRVLSSYGACIPTGDAKGGAKPYLILLGVIDVGALVMANFQAFRARSIRTEFSESQYIAAVMVSLLQACIIGLPLMFLVGDSPVAEFVIRAMLVFCICMAVLLFIFVPKYFYMKECKVEEEAKKERKAEARARREGSGVTAASERTTSNDLGKSGLQVVIVPNIVARTGRLNG